MTSFAYVGTSCLVAIAFRERGSTALRRRLDGFDDLFSSNLLEAELRAAFRREGISGDPDLARAVSWVIPNRPLSAEISRVFDAGYMRGTDAWHLATALYLAGDSGSLTFVTLDSGQQALAATLGFET